MGAPPCMQHAPEFNASRTTTLTASNRSSSSLNTPPILTMLLCSCHATLWLLLSVLGCCGAQS
jgi:hypothetical protein